MKRIFSGALMAAAVMTSGCSEKRETPAPASSSSSNAFKASCNNIRKLSTCTDYTEQAFALGEGFVKSACEATGGVYGTTPCPAPKLVGSCNIDGGQTRKYYSQGMLDYKAGDAEKDCKDLYSGKWAMK